MPRFSLQGLIGAGPGSLGTNGPSPADQNPYGSGGETYGNSSIPGEMEGRGYGGAPGGSPYQGTWTPQSDPLGNALQQRGVQNYLNSNWSNGTFKPQTIGGPGMNPQWQGYFQALQESGVNNLADPSVGARHGMGPVGMGSQDPMSNQIGTQSFSPALQALRQQDIAGGFGTAPTDQYSQLQNVRNTLRNGSQVMI